MKAAGDLSSVLRYIMAVLKLRAGFEFADASESENQNGSELSYIIHSIITAGIDQCSARKHARNIENTEIKLLNREISSMMVTGNALVNSNSAHPSGFGAAISEIWQISSWAHTAQLVT